MKKGLLTLKNRVEKFIADNKLDFSDKGSGLNSNCTTLAGFICYVQVNTALDGRDNGYEIINNLPISSEAIKELTRVYDHAWLNNYDEYWETSDATENYIF